LTGSLFTRGRHGGPIRVVDGADGDGNGTGTGHGGHGLVCGIKQVINVVEGFVKSIWPS
jgi:hypothetical protein